MNAKILHHGFDLAVLEGEASLRSPASTATVRVLAMRKASVAGGAAPAVSTISELEAGAVSAWRQGQVQFNGETLEHAVAEYNRYLSRPMEIADPSIRRIRLGGRFSATDPDEFCRALDAIYGVSARVEPDRIRLTRG
jgi:transmembrane sensor